jgi:O-antigen/teichoic acid export membrane protein
LTEVATETEAATPPLEELPGWRILVRSFSTLAVGEALARLAGLAAVVLLARRLGPAGFGVITLGLTLVGWFGLVVDSGTELLTVRDVARAPERFRQIASAVLGLRLAMSVAAAAVFVIGVQLFARSDSVRSTVTLFALALPAVALNLRWMVLGIHRARAVAIGNVAGRTVLLLGTLALVAGAQNVRAVPFLEAGAELCYGAVVLGFVARSAGIVLPRIDLASWWATLRQSAPLMVNSVARAASWSFDVLVIEIALGPRQLGLYGAGSKPVLFVTSALGLFSVAFLSAFSAQRAAAADALFRRAVRVSVGVSVPLAAAMSATAVAAIPVLFGRSYESAALVLTLLAWKIPAAAASTAYGAVLIARERQVPLMRNNLVAGALTVVADLVAIPLFGIPGAAVVGVGSTAVAAFLNHRSCMRESLVPSLPDVLRGKPSPRGRPPHERDRNGRDGHEVMEGV